MCGHTPLIPARGRFADRGGLPAGTCARLKEAPCAHFTDEERPLEAWGKWISVIGNWRISRFTYLRPIQVPSLYILAIPGEFR